MNHPALKRSTNKNGDLSLEAKHDTSMTSSSSSQQQPVTLHDTSGGLASIVPGAMTWNGTFTEQDNDGTANDDNSNGGRLKASTTARQRAKRQSKPPQKFVARPSKQGLSVEEGDAAFLNAVHSSSHAPSTSKRKRRSASKATEATRHVDAALGDSLVSNEMELSLHKIQTARSHKSTSSSPRRKMSHKTNASAAVPVRGVVLRRKSAISRRPRPVQPTEKILAMQTNVAATAAAAASSRSKPKNGSWICRSCGCDNLEARKRCSSCQGWRGGVRQDGMQTKHDMSVSSSSWQCTKCGNCVAANKARCGKCQGWRGGVRDTLATKSKTRKTKASPSRAKRDRDGPTAETGGKSTNRDGKKSVVVANAATEQERRGPVGNVTTYSENDDKHNNLDDVACCLCKCAVDFGDGFFFLPKPTTDTSKIEVVDIVQPKDEIVASAAVSSAIVSSECSVVDDVGAVGMDASSASPLAGLRGADADAARMTERILMDDASASLDGVENSKLPSVNVHGKEPSLDDGSGVSTHDPQPPFRLPHRFHDPGNSLILCDGPEYANRRKSGGGVVQYKCDRAYHQLCHFIPVFHVPRGAWRCLICRYRDNEFLRRKASKGEKRKSHEKDEEHLSDEQLSAIFRMVPEISSSPDTSSAEQLFEVLSAPLKAKLLHAELTTRAKSLINTSLSNIRTAEHSIRAFTETSKARKALMERIEHMGLPQQLIQCFARVAQAKMRIKDLVRGVENAIKNRQHHDLLVHTSGEEQADGIDVVGELMYWYSSQKAHDLDETLFRNLFPEGERTLVRRRVEPKTDEANAEADAASNSSGVSLDNLRCACCLTGHASDENDLLLCDGLGCYRAYHMCCVEPKLTLEDLAADENEHWFCPLCKAHGELIHYAQREYLGDDFFSSSPPREWERASDVFPEAYSETVVAQKLKKGIRDDEVNDFLTEALGMSFSLSAQQNSLAGSLEYPEDEEDDSDEDFNFGCQDEEDGDSSNSEESDDEEKRLLKEKIDKDELDALSVSSSMVEPDDDVMSDSGAGNTQSRRSKRKRNCLRQSHGDSNSEEEQSSGTSPPSDAGKLDTANIVYGKRNRTKVDYRKLNDAMFGDESDNEAQGADIKFAYKPKATVRCDSSSSDESEDENESSDNNTKLASVSAKAKQAKSNKSTSRDNTRSKREPTSIATSHENDYDSWNCTKCGNNNLPAKKRCSNCQGWRGGVRENIRSPATKRART